MGNTQSGSTLTRTSAALDSYVSELGADVVYEKRFVAFENNFVEPSATCLCFSLGSARFLKTVKCRNRSGYMVVKIFIKPDPGLSLRNYHRRLKGVYISPNCQVRLSANLYSGTRRLVGHYKRLQLSVVCGNRKGRVCGSTMDR
jgi:hypothetical protein